VTGTPLSFTSQLPDDMQTLIHIIDHAIAARARG